MARTTGSSAARTRARVLQAARELFTERSYAGTSIRDIAERLEMTKAALYYHFPAKEDLLRELVAPVVDELGACVRAAEDGSESSRRLLRRVVDLFDDHRHIIRGTLYDASARSVLLAKDDMFADVRALENALAASDDPADLLLARCAIGTVRGAIISTGDIDSLALNRPPEADVGPRLSEQDRELVTNAAVAVLNTGARDD